MFMVLERELPPQLLTRALDETLGPAGQAGAAFAGASELPNGSGAWAKLLCEDGVALRRIMDDLWITARQALRGTLPARRRK
jgi:hypothetical protein